jgi:hypothetical protein
LNFKGIPSQEEHKTTYSSLKINEMALSDQSDFRNFMSPEDNNEISSFPKYNTPLSPLPHKMALCRYISETDFPELAD